MKSLYKSIVRCSAAVVLAAALGACSSDKIEDLDPNKRPLAEDIDATVTVDQTTNEVTLKLNNPGCVPVWKVYTTPAGKISTRPEYHDIVTVAGTYKVEVQMYNHHGVCDGSKVYEFTIDNTLVDFAPYMRRLTDGASKTWRIASDKKGHLGCGEPGTDGLGWWSADPENKAGWGIYENRFIFTDNGKSDGGAYTYDPGTSGTIYVNTAITNLPPYSSYNTNDNQDYKAPAEKQETTFSFVVEGSDLFLQFPAGTLLGYLPNVEAYNNPKFKVNSMRNDAIELTIDNGAIAWHYILGLEGEAPFSGFKYDSDFNLWRKANFDAPFFFYAPGWAQIADPELTQNGSAYTIKLPTATTDTWQAQCHLISDIATQADKQYDFSVVLNSNTDHKGVTVKLVDTSDDNTFYFNETVKLEANKDYVFYKSAMPGIDIAKLKLVFDFGGNAENTVVTMSNVVLKDHANDDGTKLPDPEPDVKVVWVDENSADNLWHGVTFENDFYYAPGWAQIDNPGFEMNGSQYTITLPSATTEQWQAQVKFINTGIKIEAGKKYDFRVIMNSNTDHNGVTVKFTQHGNDDLFYMADRVKLTAYDDCTFTWAALDGLDIDNLDLVLDFGGNAADTKVTVSGIIIQEHRE